MSHGAADAVPEVATRMTAVNKTAPARSRVFLMCRGRNRVVIFFSPIDVQGCECSQYLSARRSLRPRGSTHAKVPGFTSLPLSDTIGAHAGIAHELGARPAGFRGEPSRSPPQHLPETRDRK